MPHWIQRAERAPNEEWEKGVFISRKEYKIACGWKAFFCSLEIHGERPLRGRSDK
jgi:hypothetical protein